VKRGIMDKRSVIFKGLSPELEVSMGVVADLLQDNPDLNSVRKKLDFGSDDYWTHWGERFLEGRVAKHYSQANTVPDPLISLILRDYFKLGAELLESAGEVHSLSMIAENATGELLERYLASELEPLGWVWCSGSSIKKIDFVGPLKNGSRQLLQVKNRDNSENSSSASVRSGTKITKWYRSKSKSGATRWNEFPDPLAMKELSEANFKKFALDYLSSLPK
jgi:hypothetical protein